MSLTSYLTHRARRSSQAWEHEPTRFVNLFRRLDTDGDGSLTMREFIMGLRGLQYKEAKKWTMRMVKRLFELCDRDKNGLLSIQVPGGEGGDMCGDDDDDDDGDGDGDGYGDEYIT